MTSSTLAQSLGAEKPGVSPANRSLERGIEILRSFRPGSELLGNAEIAERTGLSRSTVSRLTQTLVGVGVPAGGTTHQGVSPGACGPEPGARDALGLDGARHRGAAHARRGPGEADQRGPGRSRSRRNGLPGIDPIQPPAVAAQRRFRPACPDGADLARSRLPRDRAGSPAQGPARALSPDAGVRNGRNSSRRSRPRSATSRKRASVRPPGSLKSSRWRLRCCSRARDTP